MPATATCSPPAERRTAPRRQPAVNTVFRFDPGDGPLALALVWNISASGVSVLVPEPHPPGLALDGYLDTMEGDHMRAVTLRVVHCKQLETGDYALGARFDHPLSDDELKPFVAEE
jgi:hypothetical protein